MKHIFLLMILLLQVLGAQPGQGYRMPGTGVISGEVINDKTGTPIEYASVTLLNKESNEVIEGQLTDELGFFVFQEIRKRP